MRVVRLGASIAILVVLSLAGCASSSSTKNSILVTTPNAQSGPTPVGQNSINCRIPPNRGPHRSRLIFSGPCNLTETRAVRCVQRTDDYYVFVQEKLPHGYMFYTSINVEYYKKPDTYEGLVEVYVEISRGIQDYSWQERQATATVAPDGLSLTLSPTDADAWLGTLAVGTEHVSGTITCARLQH